MHVTWFDLEDAFGSVFHDLIRICLNRMKIPVNVRDYIVSLEKGCTINDSTLDCWPCSTSRCYWWRWMNEYIIDNKKHTILRIACESPWTFFQQGPCTNINIVLEISIRSSMVNPHLITYGKNLLRWANQHFAVSFWILPASPIIITWVRGPGIAVFIQYGQCIL